MRNPQDVRTRLSPIQHATMSDHHRVPVAFINGKYEIMLGTGWYVSLPQRLSQTILNR
jgi:hypothetical protein